MTSSERHQSLVRNNLDKKITHGLDIFMLNPEGLEGESLFNHMVKCRIIHLGKEESVTASYLTVDIYAAQ